MLEIDIKGVEYRLGKLDPFKQLHVARRIAPLLPSLLPAAALAGDLDGLAKNMGELVKYLEPLTAALSQLPDADCEYVYANCLAIVQRKQGNGWANVWGKGGLMFEDMDLAAMTRLVVEVIKNQLGNFTQGLTGNESRTAQNSTSK